MKKRTIIVVAIVMAALGIALGIVLSRPAPLAPTAPVALEGGILAIPSPQLEYAAGDHRSWRVQLDADSSTHLAINPDATETQTAAIEASLSLDARLHSQVIALMPEGGAHLRIWVDDVATFTFAVQGQQSEAALAEALAGAAIDLHVDACNRIVQLSTPEQTTVGHEVVQSIVESGWPAICGESAGANTIAARVTTHGEARDTLAASFVQSDIAVALTAREYTALRISNDPETTQTVSIEGTTLLRNQQLDTTRSIERIVLQNQAAPILNADTRFELSDARDHEMVAIASAVAAWRDPGTRRSNDGTDRQLLEQRARELNAEQLVGTLASYANAGTVPDHNNFLWRAPARLELEPELASALRDMATADTATSAGRGLLLDLLSQTDTSEAAVATLETLQHENVRADRMYPILLQRISFVADPPAEMVDWVAALASSGTTYNERTAARYALGSLVAALDNQERTDESNSAHAVVTQMLASTAGTDEHVHSLRALANAERISDLPTFLDASRSSNADIRIAAAAALGALQAGPSTEALLNLFADAEAPVQREAVAALRHHTLNADALNRLAQSAASATFATNNAMSLLDLAKYYASTNPEAVQAIANAVIASPVDGTVRGAAHELIRRTGAP